MSKKQLNKPTTTTTNIRSLVDDSFVPANQPTSVLYSGLTDFNPAIL